MREEELRERAQAGEPAACAMLAKRLLRGRGCARDYERAVELLNVAVAGGDADALYRLGKCYLKGVGCARDAAGGVSCLERAARNGHAAAALRLGCCFEEGLGAPRSAVLAAGGPLLTGKHAGNGVTMALAWRPFRLDWRWKDA